MTSRGKLQCSGKRGYVIVPRRGPGASFPLDILEDSDRMREECVREIMKSLLSASRRSSGFDAKGSVALLLFCC